MFYPKNQRKKNQKKKMTTPEIKKASTVIIVSPFKSAHYNWKFLMVKRHSKARFMANNYVFPGGVEVFQNKKIEKKKNGIQFSTQQKEKSDSNEEWKKLIHDKLDTEHVNKITAIRESKNFHLLDNIKEINSYYSL